MKIIGIVQARMGSTRLPGKSLMLIENKPLLAHVIERLKKAKMLDAVVVATTCEPEDDAIANFIRDRVDAYCFRGSKDDVLDRFIGAAEKFSADIVVRICADNPLIDPLEIDKLVKFHMRTNADYSNNNKQHSKGLPDGVGAEAVSLDTLKKIHKMATEKSHREHVTLFILDNLDKFHTERLDADTELRRPEFRLDIDYKEDLEFVREIYKRFRGVNKTIETKDIINLLNKNPEILQLRKNRA